MKFQSPVALTTGRIVAASVVLASLCNAPAFAAPQDAAKKEAVDPSGTWHWEHDENGVSVKDARTLNYDRKANQLTGRYKGNIGPIKIENGRIDGDKLEFRFDVDLEGTKIGLKFDGVIKGEEVNGTVSIDASGQTAEFPWTAARSLEPEDVAEWADEVGLPQVDGVRVFGTNDLAALEQSLEDSEDDQGDESDQMLDGADDHDDDRDDPEDDDRDDED